MAQKHIFIAILCAKMSRVNEALIKTNLRIFKKVGQSSNGDIPFQRRICVNQPFNEKMIENFYRKKLFNFFENLKGKNECYITM